jgi:hypothetical protein
LSELTDEIKDARGAALGSLLLFGGVRNDSGALSLEQRWGALHCYWDAIAEAARPLMPAVLVEPGKVCVEICRAC